MAESGRVVKLCVCRTPAGQQRAHLPAGTAAAAGVTAPRRNSVLYIVTIRRRHHLPPAATSNGAVPGLSKREIIRCLNRYIVAGSTPTRPEPRNRSTPQLDNTGALTASTLVGRRLGLCGLHTGESQRRRAFPADCTNANYTALAVDPRLAD